MSGRATVLSATLLGVCATAAPRLVDHSPWFVWNASASVPIGLYAISRTSDLRFGELLAVRPPEQLASFLAERNYLPLGAPLLKHVAALPGQSICRLGATITIDAIAIGAAFERDSRGRPLPVWEGCRALAADEVFLMNARVADSLDGRYFGALPAAAIIGRATPLWTQTADEEE